MVSEFISVLFLIKIRDKTACFLITNPLLNDTNDVKTFLMLFICSLFYGFGIENISAEIVH
ncbi:MAG: hypothetical protein EA360_10120 [Balneolaceae bacterium]|nr:MAG: hypothetical protein EA360_10120 [Balneolaceae bacterium]